MSDSVRVQFTEEVEVDRELDVTVTCSQCSNDLEIDHVQFDGDTISVDVDPCDDCSKVDFDNIGARARCAECGEALEVTDSSIDEDVAELDVAPCPKCANEVRQVFLVLGPWGLMPFVFASEEAAEKFAAERAPKIVTASTAAEDVFPAHVFKVAPINVTK